MSEAYYTVEQISEMLQIHPKTIQRYIREGRLKAQKIGKGWRVTGHDLSVFAEGTEGAPPPGPEPGLQSLLARSAETVSVSAIIDIPVENAAAAARIMNWATAVVHSGPRDGGEKSLSVQYLESRPTVRLLLSGNPQFIQTFLASITDLAKEG